MKAEFIAMSLNLNGNKQWVFAFEESSTKLKKRHSAGKNNGCSVRCTIIPLKNIKHLLLNLESKIKLMKQKYSPSAHFAR